MTAESREKLAEPPVLELVHPSYQPSKAELEEPIEFPESTTPDNLARALMQPGRVRYVRRRRGKGAP